MPTSNTANYYHVVINPKSEFEEFRTHDVGDPGGLQRLAGKREDGSWDTHAWLISKDMAHVENGKLVGDAADARDLIEELGGDVRPENAVD